MEYKHLLPFLAVVITFLAVNLPTSSATSARRRISPTVPPSAYHDDDDDASGDYGGVNRPGYDDEGSTDGEGDYSGDHISTRVPDIGFHDKSTRARTTTSIYSVWVDEDVDPAKGENVKIEALKVLITHPAVLAAIIIGGVLTILFIVLLVMFIIYRMRKKDEGSYVLDDPKVAMIDHQQPQQNTSALIYTKGPSNDQEFYA